MRTHACTRARICNLSARTQTTFCLQGGLVAVACRCMHVGVCSCVCTHTALCVALFACLRICSRLHMGSCALCMCAVPAHPSVRRRIVSRTWCKDPYLKVVAEGFVVKRGSITKRIQYSDVFRAKFQKNCANQRHNPTSTRLIKSLSSASHRRGAQVRMRAPPVGPSRRTPSRLTLDAQLFRRFGNRCTASRLPSGKLFRVFVK